MEPLALGVPFIELKQFGRHIPVGVDDVHEHHVAVPEALLPQAHVLLPQSGGLLLDPGRPAPQEAQQALSVCHKGQQRAKGGTGRGCGGLKMSI